MNWQSVLRELHALGLPPEQYVVVGGAALTGRGMRETEDIDLVVTEALFEQLRRRGWTEKTRPNGKPGLRMGVVEAYLDVNAEGFERSTESLLDCAQRVDGVALVDLESLARFKASYGRAKDLHDLELISRYRSNQAITPPHTD